MKEKKVSQSATKIHIISCTAAPCAPFRPLPTRSHRRCAPPTRLLVAPFRPRCAHSCAPFRRRASRPTPLHPANAPSHRALSPRPCALRPRPMRKARGFSPFPPHFPRKVPLFSKKVPTFFSLPRRRARPPRPWRKGKISHRREKVRRNTHEFTFFLLLIAFILKKTRYICNENPFYHLCVAKHRNLSSARCVRHTAYKLPHLARL